MLSPAVTTLCISQNMSNMSSSFIKSCPTRDLNYTHPLLAVPPRARNGILTPPGECAWNCSKCPAPPPPPGEISGVVGSTFKKRRTMHEMIANKHMTVCAHVYCGRAYVCHFFWQVYFTLKS